MGLSLSVNYFISNSGPPILCFRAKYVASFFRPHTRTCKIRRRSDRSLRLGCRDQPSKFMYSFDSSYCEVRSAYQLQFTGTSQVRPAHSSPRSPPSIAAPSAPHLPGLPAPQPRPRSICLPCAGLPAPQHRLRPVCLPAPQHRPRPVRLAAPQPHPRPVCPRTGPGPDRPNPSRVLPVSTLIQSRELTYKWVLFMRVFIPGTHTEKLRNISKGIKIWIELGK